MVSKSAKGLLLAMAALITGLLISAGKEPKIVVLISIATVVLMIFLVNYYVRGNNKEIFISGFVLGFIDAYVFLIQPNYPGLPELPGAAELFFGVAIITRAVILLLELIDTPAKKYVRRLVAA